MDIHLITAGGTIDKYYNEITGQLEVKNYIDTMLTQGRFTNAISTSSLMMKDSLEMTSEDRERIAAACAMAAEQRIIITHGTDTMAETADALAKHGDLKQKVIVLTGAMIPYSFGVTSDALFNLGTAIAFVQTLTPGVYVAMNGRFFRSGSVVKDKTIGVFTEKPSSTTRT